jgi:2-polyprenyl-6-methoxyphenol hydroxylase-like FAD-dependent oxidoreductase
MMLGFLLARAGVDVLLLEKHADFLRDFRGDTIHPSTLELMHELGLLEEFLKCPHDEVRQIAAVVGQVEVPVADFSDLPTTCKFLAFMPQWDFLNFLAEKAQRYPTFHLKMQAEVTGLIEKNGRTIGVQFQTPEGRQEVHADLVVGADGRHSLVREHAGLQVKNIGAPMDVLWMRLSRRPTDPPQALGRFERGNILILLARGEYWQCGFVIPKGMFDWIQKKGIAVFRERLAGIAPFLRERVNELREWDDIKLLTVVVNRLRLWWKPGLLCIGDAAHAMSPIGGVGINLAIQDAVAAANRLAEPLRTKRLSAHDLLRVQRRRIWPTRWTQGLQVIAQNQIIRRVFILTENPPLPILLKALRRWPYLRRFPARLIGMGFRPEHVQTADIYKLEDPIFSPDRPTRK